MVNGQTSALAAGVALVKRLETERESSVPNSELRKEVRLGFESSIMVLRHASWLCKSRNSFDSYVGVLRPGESQGSYITIFSTGGRRCTMTLQECM